MCTSQSMKASAVPARRYVVELGSASFIGALPSEDQRSPGEILQLRLTDSGRDLGYDASPLRAVANDPAFWLAAKNTGLIVLFAGVTALIIGSALAWLNERTDARFGTLSTILPLVPLLLPPVAIAIGWVFLAQSAAGFLNSALRSLLGDVGIHLVQGPLNIGTWPGMIFVYTIALVPYVYLVVSSALRNMDSSLEEASRMSGAGPLRTLMRVSLPAVRPALTSAGLLVLIVGVSEFSIPRTIGSLARTDVLSVYLVRLAQTFPPRNGEAVTVSLIVLAVVLCAWLLHTRLNGRGRSSTISGKAHSASLVELGPWRWVARGFMILYILSVSVVPLAAVFVVSLQRFWSAKIDVSKFTLYNYIEVLSDPSSRARDALLGSVRLGLIGATITMAFAAIMISYARGHRGRRGRVIEAVTKSPGAISHIVLAVALLIALGGPPFHLAGTQTILLLAYVIMYMPQASISAEVARGQVGDELIEASAMLGGSKGRTFRSIMLPLMRPGLAAGWTLVFIVIMGDLTASSILSSSNNPVVGAAILDIWEYGTFSQLSALATIVGLVNAIVVLIVILGVRPRTFWKGAKAAAPGSGAIGTM